MVGTNKDDDERQRAVSKIFSVSDHQRILFEVQ